jgi:hypothetical protein
MERSIWVLVLVLGFATFASAEAVLKIRSDQPARAFLNGQLLGSTPLTVTKLKAGTYTIKIENNESGEVKIYNVYSPKSATVEKEIDVEFAGDPAPVRDVAPTREVVRTTVIERRPPWPPVPQQVVTVCEEPPPPPHPPMRMYRPRQGPYNDDYYYREERQKVRSRNVLLGTAAANEIFNQGSSKGTVRAVTLGGALLNEVLREGK